MIVRGYWISYGSLLLVFLLWMIFNVINDEISNENRYAKTINMIVTKGWYLVLLLLLPLFILNIFLVFSSLSFRYKFIGISGIMTILIGVYIYKKSEKVNTTFITIMMLVSGIYITFTIFGLFEYIFRIL